MEKKMEISIFFQHFEAEVKAEAGDFSIMQLIHPPPFQTMCISLPLLTQNLLHLQHSFFLSTFPGLRRGKQSTSKIQVLWPPSGSLGGSDVGSPVSAFGRKPWFSSFNSNFVYFNVLK